MRLAERGFALHQQVNALNEELKQVKDRLKAEAEACPGEHVPLADRSSEGSQWVVVAEGCECRIIFPDARLNSEFDPAQKHFKSIRSLAGDHFDFLFNQVVLYRLSDKKNFRETVHNLLDTEKALELLELTTSPSEPKTLWKARPTF